MSRAEIYAQGDRPQIISVVSGGIEWVAEGPRHADPTADEFICTRITPNGEGGRIVQRAPELHAPGAAGELLAALEYSDVIVEE